MELKIPAIRSKMGIWFYYVGTLSFKEVSERVSPINDELHKSELLRGMIQRSITENYKNIANYIQTQEERFFNSLILAIYDGQPEWNEIRISDADGKDNYNLGIITFTGNEKIFPVDGQHRVEGIKKAIQDNPKLLDERVPVIFVGHSKDEAGMRRTRRMFSTLNRYAKPVSLRDIIALDEDDIVAIASRNLLDSTKLFGKNRILDSKNKSIPDNNKMALTTIITYYECNKELLWLLVKDKVVYGVDEKRINGRNKINEYIRHRPSDKVVENFTRECKEFWSSIIEVCTLIKNDTEVVGKFRDENGGHIFFRPIALYPFARTAARIKEIKGKSYSEIVKMIPDDLLWLQHPLWKKIIWDDVSRRMIMGNKKLTELLLLYICCKDIMTQSEKKKLVNNLKSVWDELDETKVVEKLNSLVANIR